MKDHKDDFPRIKKYRLINPAKSHIGKMSKTIIEKVNAELRNKLMLTQWKNSKEVTDWFNRIDGKSRKCFVGFDIVEYYPSIKKKHLGEALNFARQHTKISQGDEDIILNACKTILMHDGDTWRKKDADDLFDVPMGSFHGAEVCDLVGLMLLDRMSSSLPAGSYGLYRDDGLAFTDIVAPTHLERLKKKIISLFKQAGFKITIDVGMMRTNFLDVTLDMANDTFYPYRKPNSKILYINKDSNHPGHIKKGIAGMIEKRLSGLSKSSDEFHAHKNDYEAALRQSGLPHDLKYDRPAHATSKRRRRRACIYYNPPFCQSVKTNIGKEFLKLIEKHFYKTHAYRKIFNRSTVKISYSCMPNMKSMINGHNKKILTKSHDYPDKTDQDRRKCNCQKKKKDLCPLNGNCVISNVIYEATISTNDETKKYIGSTGGEFKKRWYGHMKDIKDVEGRRKALPATSTELAKYVQKLTDKREEYNIEWKVLRKINQNSHASKVCTTCNLERYEIAMADKRSILNKRKELVGKCVHHQKCYF